MTFPNLIVAGAQKCGTTSLHWLLSTHPDVYLPRRPQELHYFDLESNYRRGKAWYASHFTTHGGEKLIAQTSPLYLYHPQVAARMHELLPDARLVFILREPAGRAYSHYWHEVRYGWETETFERALEFEPERIKRGPEERRHYSYADRGRYASQLSRFAQRYGRDRILVLLQDELRTSPAHFCARLAAFLGIDPAGFDAATAARVYNQSRRPRSLTLQRVARHARQRFWPIGWAVDRINLRVVRYPPMGEETRARLTETFASENSSLATDWGLDLSAWQT